MSLLERGRVHFIGIGGAGMSAIAKVLLERGVEVSGSDLKRSRAAIQLEAMGATVHVGHEAEAVVGAGVVVVSAAIRPSNPELLAAQEQGIPVLSRGQALADVLAGHKSIIVAGTHGKTTTTSMIVTILERAGLDPTYLIGAGLNDAGTNARSGSGELAVAESDESDGSFLLLSPSVAVVTNVEQDHVDHWESMEALWEAFASFIASTEDGGAVIVPGGDARLEEIARSSGRRVVLFGEGGVNAEDASPGERGIDFRLTYDGAGEKIALQVPGAHNVSNALAAAAACLEVGVTLSQIASGLAAYSGVERRFQLRGEAAGVSIIDDYAHHPTEVKATLAAARAGRWERVLAVFQPHRYSRTQAFADDFGASFTDADRVVVTDVYGAGEEPVPGVSGKLISDAVCARLPGRPVAYLPHRAELVSYLKSSVRAGDAVLTMGAGDVTSLGEELLLELRSGSTS